MDPSSANSDQVHSLRFLPPWDRTVDIVCHKYKHGERRPILEELFKGSLELFLKDGHGTPAEPKGYFRLPPNVRFQICQHLMAHTHRRPPISLSRRTFVQDTWSNSDLASFGDSIAPIRSYLNISSSFRADMLVTFLSIHTFYTVLSPYVNTRISPLAATWLLKYGPYMQSLILEVDMTKLGLGPTPGAADLHPGLGHVEHLLERIGESQMRRGGPLKELILLCRKFRGRREDLNPKKEEASAVPKVEQSSRASTRSAKSQRSGSGSTSSSHRDRDSQGSTGVRPASADNSAGIDSHDYAQTHKTSDSEAILQPYYCPEEHLSICNQLLRLQGRALSLRMCGFSEAYTRQFVAMLFPGDDGRYAYRLAPSGSAWPRLKGQSSWIDTGGGLPVRVDYDTPTGACSCDNRLMPPPPVVHHDGSLSLPRIDKGRELRPRPKDRGMGFPSSSSLSESARNSGSEINKMGKIKKLLEKCGVGNDKARRALTRQASSAL